MDTEPRTHRSRVGWLWWITGAAIMLYGGVLIGWSLRGSDIQEAQEADFSERRRASVQFLVRKSPSQIMLPEKFDPDEFNGFRRTQTAYAKSRPVMLSALGENGGKLTSLGIFAGLDEEAQLNWLHEHVVASFPQDGEFFEIAVIDDDASEKELKEIAEAVARAYNETVNYQEMASRQLPMKLLREGLSNLTTLLDSKRTVYASIASDMGKGPVGHAVARLKEERVRALESERLEIRKEMRQEERQYKLSKPSSGDKETSTARWETTKEILSARLAEQAKEITSLTSEIKQIHEVNSELQSKQQEIEQLKKVIDGLAFRIHQLQIDSQSPNRITPIGVTSSGSPGASFHPGGPIEFGLL